MEPAAARIAIESVKSTDFYLPRHRTLFRVLQQLFMKYGTLDELYVGRVLEHNRLTDQCGGLDYLGKIVIDTPSAANVENYCSEVLRRASERAEIERAHKILQNVKRGLVQPKSNGTVVGSLAAMDQEIADIRAGKRVYIPIPLFPQLSRATRMFSVGKLAAICGGAGKGKSLFTTQLLMELQKQWLVAMLELEDGVVFHTRRSLSQITGIQDFTRDEWFLNDDNFAVYNEAKRTYAEQLKPFMKSLHQLHRDEKPTFDFVLEWIRNRASDGVQIIGIDPFTKLRKAAGDRRQMHDAQHEFIVDAINIVERYNSRFFMVTHPRKPTKSGRNGEAEMEDIAGSAAIGNHARCIIWYGTTQEKEMDVRTLEAIPVQTRRVNRIVKILKANESYGAGMKLGYFFDAEKTLKVTEQGIIE